MLPSLRCRPGLIKEVSALKTSRATWLFKTLGNVAYFKAAICNRTLSDRPLALKVVEYLARFLSGNEVILELRLLQRHWCQTSRANCSRSSHLPPCSSPGDSDGLLWSRATALEKTPYSREYLQPFYYFLRRISLSITSSFITNHVLLNPSSQLHG